MTATGLPQLQHLIAGSEVSPRRMLSTKTDRRFAVHRCTFSGNSVVMTTSKTDAAAACGPCGKLAPKPTTHHLHTGRHRPYDDGPIGGLNFEGSKIMVDYGIQNDGAGTSLALPGPKTWGGSAPRASKGGPPRSGHWGAALRRPR